LVQEPELCQNETNNDMATQKLTKEIIHAAIFGFEEQKRKLDSQIADLRAMLSGASAEPSAVDATRRPRRKMSAAGRRAIAAGQRKRWEAAKGQSVPEEPVAPKAKRKLSAAGRAAIVAATKKRWALKRAEAAKK
jgi:hypothetical protein